MIAIFITTVILITPKEASKTNENFSLVLIAVLPVRVGESFVVINDIEAMILNRKLLYYLVYEK